MRYYPKPKCSNDTQELITKDGHYYKYSGINLNIDIASFFNAYKTMKNNVGTYCKYHWYDFKIAILVDS